MKLVKGHETKMTEYTVAIKGKITNWDWKIYSHIHQTTLDSIQKDIADSIEDATLIILERITY